MTDATGIDLKHIQNVSVLYVMAAKQEYGDHLSQRIAPLFTGVGPVEAGTQLGASLAALAQNNAIPDIIISLGSAGSATLPQTGIYQASTISYRDMDASALGFEKGTTPFLDLPVEIEIPLQTKIAPAARLSTGANVISGAAYEAIDADMVDMESFALLRAAQMYNRPFITLRGISDGAADLNHIDDWTRYLHIIDEKLAATIDRLEDELPELIAANA